MSFVDMNVLVKRSNHQRLSNGGVLSLSPLLPSSTIIVSNLPQNTQDITLLSHFQRFSGGNTIINVKLLPSDKALVTFVNYKCKFVELNFHTWKIVDRYVVEIGIVGVNLWLGLCSKHVFYMCRRAEGIC